MNELSSIFASPHTDNFQDLMRKNFKRGNKTLTQVSFSKLETGHVEFYNAFTTDNPMNLDIVPKYIRDFNVVGFDCEVYIGKSEKGCGPTLIVMAAGSVSDRTLEFLQEYNNSTDTGWAGLLCDAFEKRGPSDETRTIYESLIGNFVVYLFKDGELFVFSDGQQLRADNRLNISATALGFSKTYPQRTLIKIDVESEKLYPVMTF